MIQELLFHRMRKASRDIAVKQARDAAELCSVHDFDRAVMTRALELVAESDTIRGRDAVHAATALRHGLSVIVSPDRAFDGIPGLERLDPDSAFRPKR